MPRGARGGLSLHSPSMKRASDAENLRMVAIQNVEHIEHLKRMKEKEEYRKHMWISQTKLAVDGDDAHREWLKKNPPPPKPLDSDDEEAKSPRIIPYNEMNPEHYDLAIAQERHELEQGQGKRKRELDY